MRLRHLSVFVLLAVTVVSLTAWGEGYRTSIGEGDDAITVLVVRGSAYEMGRSIGALLKDEVEASTSQFLAAARAEDAEMYTPEKLDAAWKATAPNTDPRFLDELRGIIDGSGASETIVRRAHMAPVVAPWACSCIAVWGDASKDGNLYQIRNLDFMTGAGLQDRPVIVVHLPDKGIAHADATFAGFVGVNTGINAEGIVLSEKGAAEPDGYPYDLNGAHFFSVFRTLLYDADSLAKAVKILRDTQWIKSYYFVVGSGKDKDAIKAKVEAPDITIWTDNDPTDDLYPIVMKDGVLITMDDPLALEFLEKHRGKHDQNTLIELSRALGTDNGNLLNVVYDGGRLEMWVAYAEKDTNAKTRPYVHFNLHDYLKYDPAAPGVTAVVD
ncbi:MAG: hypothetical protein GWP08_12420 [Nitrospiraceae bacterium]|nr:hypothetical protein [Nitrospiraceae bacterium]